MRIGRTVLPSEPYRFPVYRSPDVDPAFCRHRDGRQKRHVFPEPVRSIRPSPVGWPAQTSNRAIDRRPFPDGRRDRRIPFDGVLRGVRPRSRFFEHRVVGMSVSGTDASPFLRVMKQFARPRTRLVRHETVATRIRPHGTIDTEQPFLVRRFRKEETENGRRQPDPRATTFAPDVVRRDSDTGFVHADGGAWKHAPVLEREDRGSMYGYETYESEMTAPCDVFVFVMRDRASAGAVRDERRRAVFAATARRSQIIVFP